MGWLFNPDEIREYRFFRLGQAVALLLRGDGLDEEGDVAAEDVFVSHVDDFGFHAVFL